MIMSLSNNDDTYCTFQKPGLDSHPSLNGFSISIIGEYEIGLCARIIYYAYDGFGRSNIHDVSKEDQAENTQVMLSSCMTQNTKRSKSQSE